MEPAVGIEPTTHGLQNRCSTAELSWLTVYVYGLFVRFCERWMPNKTQSRLLHLQP